MTISSYISPKTKKGRKSAIHGRGLYAVRKIRKGEIVAIKGGHIIDKTTLNRFKKLIGDSYIQIDDSFFLAPLRKSEVERVMMFLNHSCSPNVGVQGQILFVALRNIRPGEELTLDYAMTDNETSRMNCHCGTKNCRGVVTGKDWKRKDLQRKYGNYFSSYLLAKMK